MRRILLILFAISEVAACASRCAAEEPNFTPGTASAIPATLPTEAPRFDLAPSAPPAVPGPADVYLPSQYQQSAALAPAVAPPANVAWTDPTVVAASNSLPVAPRGEDDSAFRLASLESKVNSVLQAASGSPTYPTVKINGVFQIDSGWVNQDQASKDRYGEIKDGVDFRRARLAASGALTDVTNYFFQMDFAFFGRPTFTDLWVEQTDIPILGNVRVGQWKQPFSLEVVSSFRYTTFAERSVLFQPFTPFRHIGIGFYNRNEALTSTWAGSAFAAGNDQFGGSISTAGGIGTAERITWLPQYDEPSGGRYYTHLGLGHYFSAPNDHNVNFRTIPELYIGQFNQSASGPNQQPTPTTTNGMPFFVATGNLSVYNYNVLGSELLWVRGPLSLQAEGMLNIVNQTAGDNLYFTGGYATLGYFLTGEHRPYDRRAGAIDRIKPFENVFRVRSREGVCGGWGAWEVAARISTLNLNGNYTAGPPSGSSPAGSLTGGGIITDTTLGLNWYLNAYLKAQLNYIHSHTTNNPGLVALTNLFDIRVQMDF